MNSRLRLTPIQIAFLFFQLILIIIIISTIAITNSSSTDPSASEFTETTTLADLDVPENIINILQITISNTALKNTSTQTTFDTSSLTIRQNSTTLITNDQNHYINFITDIPTLQQSYRTVYEWTDAEITGLGTPLVFCLSQSEQIYPTSNCQDNFNNHGSEYVLSQKLSNRSFTNFSVSTTNYNSDDFKIYLFLQSNTTPETATTELKTYIKSLGFDPDLYTYIPTSDPTAPDKVYSENHKNP